MTATAIQFGTQQASYSKPRDGACPNWQKTVQYYRVRDKLETRYSETLTAERSAKRTLALFQRYGRSPEVIARVSALADRLSEQNNVYCRHLDRALNRIEHRGRILNSPLAGLVLWPVGMLFSLAAKVTARRQILRNDRWGELYREHKRQFRTPERDS